MTQSRPIILGERAFDVPPLPLRINREVFPVCRQLMEDDLVGRTLAQNGQLAASNEELAKLIDICFQCAKLAEPELTREEFDDLPITPPELLDAFFIIRYQTGAWIPAVPRADADAAGDDGDAGERDGA